MTRTIVLVAYAVALMARPLAAQADPPAPAQYAAPDFSQVTSASDLEQLVARGVLVPVLVVPLAFGGSDDALNTAYLPPEAAAEKELIDATLADLAEQGLLNSFELVPERRGASLVPARIVFHANHLGEGERFDLTVDVW